MGMLDIEQHKDISTVFGDPNAWMRTNEKSSVVQPCQHRETVRIGSSDKVKCKACRKVRRIEK